MLQPVICFLHRKVQVIDAKEKVRNKYRMSMFTGSLIRFVYVIKEPLTVDFINNVCLQSRMEPLVVHANQVSALELQYAKNPNAVSI